MAKAILVIDMPESCKKCQFKDFNVFGDFACYCMDKYNQLERDMDERRPDWCPLRGLPEYKRQFSDKGNTIEKNAGFNECLDKILGKE